MPVSGGTGVLLSMVGPGRRRAVALLNGSLTIIVLTLLTTFSSGAFVFWKLIVKRMNSLRYSHRDAGSSDGPPQARDRFTRFLGMPCADRLRRISGARPNPDLRHAPPRSRRLHRAPGFATAQDQ